MEQTLMFDGCLKTDGSMIPPKQWGLCHKSFKT